MKKEITLHYPAQYRPVATRCFVAFGEAVEIQDVKAVLKDAKKRIIAEGRTLQRPPRWVVFFAGVDVLPGDYALEVSEVGVTIPFCIARTLTFAGPDPPGIHIAFPAEGEVVGTRQLVATGTTDQNLRVRARLTIPTASGAVERTAEQIQGPPETPYWVVAFADLPAATGGARLEVFSSGGASAVCEGLRVEG
jgi:hypothetical protein